jgi:hypothetical protein
MPHRQLTRSFTLQTLIIQGSVLTPIGALERSAKPLIYTTGSGIVADSAGREYASSVVFTEDT